MNNKKITNYTSNKLNAITLVIEKDNIIYKRNYYIIEYSPLKITEYEISSIYLNPKNENDSSNCGLCNEVTNIDIKNSYSEKKYITFKLKSGLKIILWVYFIILREILAKMKITKLVIM